MVLAYLLALSTPTWAQEGNAEPEEDARVEVDLGGRVRFEAPSGCIDEGTLIERTEKSVRPELLDEARSVEGRVSQPAADRFTVDFDVKRSGEPFGRRHLDFATNDCRTLDESLELVLAMLLEGSTTGVERAEAEPVEAPPAPAEEEPPPPPEEPRRSVVSVGAAARLSLGMTPTPVVGPWLDLRLALTPWLVVGASGGYVPASAAEEEGADETAPAGSRVVVRGGSAALEGCVRAFERGISLYGCLGAGFLMLRGAGENVDNPKAPRWATAFGDASLRAEAPFIGPSFLWLGAHLEVPFTSATFHATGDDGGAIDLFSTESVWGAVELGVGLPL